MNTVLEIHLLAGALLFREGEKSGSAYIVKSGQIVLYRMLPGGRVDIERRGPGSIIGEMSVLTNRPRGVTVEAMTDCTFYKIPPQQILQRFENLDPILRACVETSIRFSTSFAEQITHGPHLTAITPSILQNPDELIDQFRFETELHKAVGSDEFSLVYQPIVSIHDGAILGFEALMRWHHPVMGFVPPDQFIAVAERTGAIKPLTEFAVLEACGALARIQNIGPHAQNLFVTINISGHDIGRSDFVDHLAFTFDRQKIQPHHVKLELTETALIENVEIATVNLLRIRELGCGVSIDDFGTGYSNLAYLKTVPLSAIKIDRAFAGDAHADAVSRSIVKMVVGLGADIGVDIVAEGLETVDDVNVLSELGCQFAQGYYFHRPMKEVALAAIIAATKCATDVA